MISICVALGNELFESDGDIVIQPITAALLVHITVGVTVYLIVRRLR